MQKVGWFEALGVTQGHRKHRHLIDRIPTYDLLFDFNRNYESIL